MSMSVVLNGVPLLTQHWTSISEYRILLFPLPARVINGLILLRMMNFKPLIRFPVKSALL